MDEIQELRSQLGAVQIAQREATDILIEQLAEIKRIREQLLELQGDENA